MITVKVSDRFFVAKVPKSRNRAGDVNFDFMM